MIEAGLWFPDCRMLLVGITIGLLVVRKSLIGLCSCSLKAILVRMELRFYSSVGLLEY